MLRFLEGVVSILFNRIYDGVYFDSEGYSKLTEAARKGPLIFALAIEVMWITSPSPTHCGATE